MSTAVNTQAVVVPAVVIRAEDQFVILVEHRAGRLPLQDAKDGMQVAGSPPMTWLSADGLVECADLSFLDQSEGAVLRQQWQSSGVLLFQVGSFKINDPLSDPVGLFFVSE